MSTTKELLDNKIEYMAYERAHSAGQEEVNMIAASMKNDFKEVYELLAKLEKDNVALRDACIEATSLFDNYPECYEAVGTYQVLNNAINL